MLTSPDIDCVQNVKVSYSQRAHSFKASLKVKLNTDTLGWPQDGVIAAPEGLATPSWFS